MMCVYLGGYVFEWMTGWVDRNKLAPKPAIHHVKKVWYFELHSLSLIPFWSGMRDPISKCRESTQATGYHEKIQSPSKPYLASFPGEPENEAKPYLYINISPNTSLLWQGMSLKTSEVLSLGDVHIWTQDLRWKGIHEWAIRRTVDKWAGELVHHIKPSDHEPRVDT